MMRQLRLQSGRLVQIKDYQISANKSRILFSFFIIFNIR